MNQLKNNVVKEQIKAAQCKWILKNTKCVSKYFFVKWRLQSRQRQNTENTEVSFSFYEHLIQIHRQQILNLIINANQTLQRFCADLVIQNTPEDVNVFKEFMFKRIRDIQSKIAWVYDPKSYISHDKLVRLVILKGRNVLPAVVAFQQNWRRFLGKIKFVKGFCHLLPSNIKYVEFTHTENGVVKTGMRLKNESVTEVKDSYVKTKEACALICEEITKRYVMWQKKREESIDARNRWFLYTRLTICLVGSVMVMVYTSQNYERNKIGRV